MLQAEIEGETAGDPMRAKKWLRRSLRKLQCALRQRGYYVGRGTLRRMLKALGYSLQSNRKRLITMQSARDCAGPGPGLAVPLPAARAQALRVCRAPGHQRGHEEKRAHRQLQERRAHVAAAGVGCERP